MKATAATEIAATELTAANAELSGNAELTASNAELTAANAELTATTVELTAANAELHANAKIMVDVSELVIALHREPCSPSTLNRFLNVNP
jgi:hypothetical protein